MKTIRTTVPEIKQTMLDSYKSKAAPDTVFQIKEASKGRGLGVFVVKILPSSAIDFYFQYFVDGKPKSKKIGRFGSTKGCLTLAKAKAEFRELSATYSAGVDPKVQEQEIAKQALEAKQALDEAERIKNMQGSLAQLAEYFLDHLKQYKGETHYNNVAKAFKKDLFIISPDKKASDVTKADVIAVLHSITERGSLIMANRMRAYLSAMFQYGIFFDDSVEAINKKTQFLILANPVQAVQKIVKNEKKGDRALNEDEVRVFWKVLDNSEMSIYRVNAFKLMLLTGCRVEEIAGLRWSEIDFYNKTLTLPSNRTKNKLAHIIPLNELAMDIIQNNPKTHDDFLFPSGNGYGYLPTDGFSQALSRILKTINIERFVPRDLRRTFKTLTGKAGISKEIRDRLQNHALQDVSSLHYDRYDYLREKQEAMDAWSNFLKQIIFDNNQKAI